MPPEVSYVPDGWLDVEVSDSVQAGVTAAREKGIPIIELSFGDQLQLSEHVTVDVHETLWDENSVNDMSLLLEVRYFDTGVLFTGDLSQDGEPEVLPDIDILKVPHHGSATGSSPAFLDATTPTLAVISVGDNNYGHPSDKTLESLRKVGSDILRTDQCGAITVTVLPDGAIRTDTYLQMEETS